MKPRLERETEPWTERGLGVWKALLTVHELGDEKELLKALWKAHETVFSKEHEWIQQQQEHLTVPLMARVLDGEMELWKVLSKALWRVHELALWMVHELGGEKELGKALWKVLSMVPCSEMVLLTEHNWVIWTERDLSALWERRWGSKRQQSRELRLSCRRKQCQ